ncbi:MAG: hypothetical protein ABW039_04795 [Sphingobium sp.]
MTFSNGAAGVDGALALLGGVSARASQWLVDRVGSDGAPWGSEIANCWWRVPWALLVAGHVDPAGAVLNWVERNALTSDGDLRDGPFGGGLEGSPVYQLSHLAIAAHLDQRWDLADRLYKKVLQFRQPSGGIRSLRAPEADEEDWLLTAQLGLLGVMFRDEPVAAGCYRWFERVWAAQPELDRLRLYTGWRNGALLTDLDTAKAGPRFVDHRAERHYYFQAGGAVAFLADYARWKDDPSLLPLSRAMLNLNLKGTDAQFTDARSVHICKFGWGVAQIAMVDREVDWLPQLLKVSAWFAERQEPSGAWPPSLFTLDRDPNDFDRMWKTAEHLMEVRQLIAALHRVGPPQAG